MIQIVSIMLGGPSSSPHSTVVYIRKSRTSSRLVGAGSDPLFNDIMIRGMIRRGNGVEMHVASLPSREGRRYGDGLLFSHVFCFDLIFEIMKIDCLLSFLIVESFIRFYVIVIR